MGEVKRIQQKRTKGWRMPPNTVSVTRPGKWGNSFRPVQTSMGWVVTRGQRGLLYCLCENERHAIEECCRCFREYMTLNEAIAIRQELRGKNLACFCPLDQPCHADVLLKLANAEAAAA